MSNTQTQYSSGLDHLLATVLVALGVAVLLGAVPLVVMGNDCSEGAALACLSVVVLIATTPIAAVVLGLIAYLASRATPPRVLGPFVRMVIAAAVVLVAVVLFAQWMTLGRWPRGIGLPVIVLVCGVVGALVGAVFGPVLRRITLWRVRLFRRAARRS